MGNTRSTVVVALQQSHEQIFRKKNESAKKNLRKLRKFFYAIADAKCIIKGDFMPKGETAETLTAYHSPAVK